MENKKVKSGARIMQKALVMCERNLVPVRVQPDTWEVPSATRLGVVYTITVRDEKRRLKYECNCKATVDCKHIYLVAQEFNRDNRHWIALLDLQEQRAGAFADYQRRRDGLSLSAS